ncbi:Fe-S-containing protein [Dissulfurispira thermophila]|uniref:Fe-S-containing protein n=1 Tax=Dissulfurispira thermophila TaxID=2715679 RepID=UPI00193D6709|nr:Fe-S-containing protein [Dissulfurispira thermophila]
MFFAIFLFLISCSQKISFLEPSTVGEDVVINIDNLTEKSPIFYKTKIDDTTIEFFVIKVKGQTHAYLNRCRRCFNSGLGFAFDKEYMRCKSCNIIIPIDELSEGIGSCYPIHVNGRLINGQYHIARKGLYSAYHNKF